MTRRDYRVYIIHYYDRTIFFFYSRRRIRLFIYEKWRIGLYKTSRA